MPRPVAMAIVCGEAGIMHGSPPGGEPSKQYPSAWFPLSSNVILPPRGQEMLRLDFLILHPVSVWDICMSSTLLTRQQKLWTGPS